MGKLRKNQEKISKASEELALDKRSKKPIKKILSRLVRSKSKDRDLSRKELVLNTILLGSIALAFVAFLVVFVNQTIIANNYQGIPFIAMLVILLLFVLLFMLSRKGYIRTSAVLLVLLFLLPNLFTVLTWGPDLPQGLLTFALIIVLAGIVVGSKFALVLTALICFLELVLVMLYNYGIYKFDYTWRQIDSATSDVIPGITTLALIMLIAWLSNSEIEHSLKRAIESEKRLKKERDMLEVRVRERTKQLEDAQREKIAQLSKFAEFGKTASGIFHDLVNPLTVLTLHLNHLKKLKPEEIKDLKLHLGQALQANRRMLDYIDTIRQKLQKKEEKSFFSINREIEESIKLLSYKADSKNIKITFKKEKELPDFFQSRAELNKVMMNLISNAIDAFENFKKDEKEIIIKTSLNDKGEIIISVSDNGPGIKPKNQTTIFKPFFTTKDPEKGMGIGLFIVKEIIEDFGGNISFESSKEGTTFLIRLKMTITAKKDLIG